MDSNVTLDQVCHPAKNGFHSLGVQPDPRYGCDCLGGHSIPVMEPKNGSISHQNLAGIKSSYNVVNLPQCNFVVNRQTASAADRWMIQRSVLRECLGLTGVPFLSAFGFEVIENHTGSDNFEKSINGIALSRLEVPQQSAVVGTHLKVGFLDEVVYEMLSGVRRVASRSSPHYLSDQRLKSANEFCPCGIILGTDTRFGQVFRR